MIFDSLNIPLETADILHFAPEWWLFRQLKKQPGYVGGDIQKRPNANAIVDITQIDAADNSFDILICNHVLEHVPADRLAMSECFRVLRNMGVAIFSVPIDTDRQTTWEPPADMPKAEVEKICGWDHKRIYGLDFADKLRAVGFSVRAVSPDAETQEKYRVYGDDIIFLAAKGKEPPNPFRAI